MRLHESAPAFDQERFAAHERFFVGDLGAWAQSRFGVTLPAVRTAVVGASVGGALALALGLRHPDRYGAIFCASPGAGYRPPDVLPQPLPRTYLVAGTQEPFFLENAARLREFWERIGGLAVFGSPVAEQREEQIEGRPTQAQWFERNRLELHPENQRPYDVLIGGWAMTACASRTATGAHSRPPPSSQAVDLCLRRATTSAARSSRCSGRRGLTSTGSAA